MSLTETNPQEQSTAERRQSNQHIEQFLTFILGKETYGLDILRVQEIRGWEATTRLPGVPEYVKGVINIRGAVVPIVDMRERFHIGEPSYDESTVVIITRMSDKACEKESKKIVGLVVDGVSDVEDVDLNSLQNAPSFNHSDKVNQEFIKGLASTEDKMVILLDVDRLLSDGVFSQLRWSHWKLGMIPPSVFVPVAEKNGLVEAMTDYLIDRVLNDLLTWKSQGRDDVRVSINLSPQSLNDLTLPERLTQKICEKSISPTQLILEITETAQEADPEKFADVLLRLRLKGFRLSIDDFGTGTSSMARLQQLPFNEIKIDRSFVSNIHQDDKKQSIVTHMVSMGKKLGLNVVVEGVETQDELNYINKLKPDFIQGYYYSHPLDPKATQAWLNQNQVRRLA